MIIHNGDKISSSIADYIEAIDTLTRRHGHAHTKDIATQLGIKMPSVTSAMGMLSKRGYIHYASHCPVSLTPEGQRIADRIRANHHTMELFFQRFLSLPPEEAHRAASAIDHILEPEVVRRFTVFSQAIEGRTDSVALATHLSEAMEFVNSEPMREYGVLTDLPTGCRCRFVKRSRNLSKDKDLLEPGELLEVGTYSIDRSVLRVMRLEREENSAINIPVAEAENLWVVVEERGEGKGE